ncbi:MAG TPA: heparan-alpha-glucosaminide N-acetyltransferase domain-containing protein [Flavitalea sp.]|nr:heparan-alpha-glucosaminide N-acetyltransferase domain-containing protein [Flavitalea sp.]
MNAPARYLALDVFRGLTICLMIIVNTPGNGATTFAPLNHAAWHGFTPTDLVFPSFLFAVGNALSFVMNKWERMSTGQVVWKILKRTFLIFLLGYLMYWFPFFKYDQSGSLVLSPVANTRIFGVLQRIALCYGIAALMLYFLKPRATLVITLLILVIYGPLLWLTGSAPDPLSLPGNGVLVFDRWLMGESHMYHGDGIAFDPEGFLSTFPAIANVVGGFFAGKYLQLRGKTFETLSRLLLAGFVLISIAFLWNYSLPINKKLWTSSFSVLTIGIDLGILACVIYIIDFLHKTRWTFFFEVFGRNPLFIYLLSEVGVIILFLIPVGGIPLYRWLYQHVFAVTGAYIGSLLFAVSWMLICWLVGYWMDKKGVYVKV